MNRNYTGRQQELLRIHEVLQGHESDASHQRIMVLHGLGGMGKTQLATQYAYTYEKDYTSIWWKLITHHAQMRTRSGKEPGHSWMGTMLRLPPDVIDETGRLRASTDSKPIIEAAKMWLADEENQKWLLIIDNYDDLENMDITEFLPTRSPGSVIITSRVRDSRRLSESLEKLGAPPLVFDQAASIYHGSIDQQRIRRDCIQKAPKISFAALGPAAQQLLLLCGFFDNEDIWEGLLPLERLKEFGIGKSPCERLDKVEKGAKASNAASLTSVAISFGEAREKLRYFALERRLLPHVRLCANHICRDNYLASVQTDQKRFKEVEILRTVLLYHRELPYAEDLTRWTLVRYEEALGEDHPDMLTTVNCMGEVLEGQGRYDSALEFFQRALTGREKISKDDPDTLTTVNCVASVLDSQGKYNESIEQYERALRGREKALGMDHPDTLTTVDNMALVLNKLGRYDKALEWYRRALKGREERLGENHPDTLTTVINMAWAFHFQGKYNDVQRWVKSDRTFAKAIWRRLEVVGPGFEAGLMVDTSTK
ncbi:hypothetical protein DFP73DRAFT_620673 [Morchella snyderi]|nr:hypothetical protein DFP73DRAFT_620673 [Morchella snyderi]